jgi:hypothetical protein
MNPYSPPGAAPLPYPPAAMPAPAQGGVSTNAIDLLKQTRPWVIMMSVLCFISVGFMLLAGLGMFAMALLMPRGGAQQAILGVVYLPLALVYIYPAVKLWSYGSSISRLSATSATADLEAALGHQKSFWKYCGILTLVMIVVYIFAIIAVVIAGVAGGLSHGHF